MWRTREWLEIKIIWCSRKNGSKWYKYGAPVKIAQNVKMWRARRDGKNSAHPKQLKMVKMWRTSKNGSK